MMIIKLIILTVVIALPLLIYWFVNRKEIEFDNRKIVSYFLLGSWFGMCGEIFLDRGIYAIFHVPLWEYRILPIHHGFTSYFGPVMWGLAAIYVCFFKLATEKTPITNRWTLFLSESVFLLTVELFFNGMSYWIFREYFFYYTPPDLGHFSSLVTIPFWWIGFKMIYKASQLLYKNERFNVLLAIMMIVVVLWGI